MLYRHIDATESFMNVFRDSWKNTNLLLISVENTSVDDSLQKKTINLQNLGSL